MESYIYTCIHTHTRSKEEFAAWEEYDKVELGKCGLFSIRTDAEAEAPRL